jgi:hypothetical protein
MLTQIASNTPLWVWFLLIALVWLGHSLSKRRTATLAKVLTLPVIMVGMSLQGTLSAFGPQPLVLGAWGVAGLITLTLVMGRALPTATRYDPVNKCFDLPGSWLPMLLILGIFFTKYSVGVITALQAELVQIPAFSLSLAALYGAFSGVFLGRAGRLLRLSLAVSRT